MDALKAQMRQEVILAGERVPVEQRSSEKRVTLASAVAEFLAERETQTDDLGLKRWRSERSLLTGQINAGLTGSASVVRVGAICPACLETCTAHAQHGSRRPDQYRVHDQSLPPAFRERRLLALS